MSSLKSSVLLFWEGTGFFFFALKTNNFHPPGTAWCWFLHASTKALKETLRSVCIFLQSDWSKAQPLMYHFTWTQWPNENTHTYELNLIKGHCFSTNRKAFFERKRKNTFEINIFNLFFCKLKLLLWDWCPRGPTLKGLETEAAV